MKNKLNLFVAALVLIFVSCTGQTTEKTKVFKKATLGTGCFWCTETIFDQLKGVQEVASGYSGGHLLNPSYKDICTGTTGHAEVVELTYDENVISFSDLLEVFWEIHDPTTLNRQGADVGTQYRSVIFYHSIDQKKEAELYKNKLNKEQIFSDPVVTEISPSGVFYKAEDYHQDYYLNNGGQPYCQIVITPKVEKFKKIFSDKIK
jgi:peptide-methionine (S)-S-oxide reductase